MARTWPSIPYETDTAGWADTCSALHLWSQIVGKYRLSHTPWVNHSWHATLYVVPRGLTTGPVHEAGAGCVMVTLDLVDHRLVVEADGGAREHFALGAMSVADFYARTKDVIETAGGTFAIHGAPNELPDATPFAADTETRPYDADAVERFRGALKRIVPVFERFRTGFLGKVSPVHLFWGSFDLAVTRFSGRAAPLHPGGFPNLPDAVTREAYSHEVSSAGFWPGNRNPDGSVTEAMFYSYAYPSSEGFGERAVAPDAVYFHTDLGEFVLPYAAVAGKRRSGRHADGLPAIDLRCRGGWGEVGPRGARLPASGAACATRALIEQPPLGQIVEAAQDVAHLLAEWGEAVGDGGRNGRFDLAPDQPVRFQLAQALREHLGRYAGDGPAQHAEAARPRCAQCVDHMRLPLPPQRAQQGIGRACRHRCLRCSWLGNGFVSDGRGGFHSVTTFTS